MRRVAAPTRTLARVRGAYAKGRCLAPREGLGNGPWSALCALWSNGRTPGPTTAEVQVRILAGQPNQVGPTLLEQRRPRIMNPGIGPLSYDRFSLYS
jgi:hypothetical protein